MSGRAFPSEIRIKKTVEREVGHKTKCDDKLHLKTNKVLD